MEGSPPFAEHHLLMTEKAILGVKKLNGLVSQNCMVGNEGHHSGGLKINFDHPGFFNTHQKHGTQSFFNSTPTGMQPPWAGIEPTNSCSAAECHSHLATGPRKKNY